MKPEWKEKKQNNHYPVSQCVGMVAFLWSHGNIVISFGGQMIKWFYKNRLDYTMGNIEYQEQCLYDFAIIQYFQSPSYESALQA